MTQDVKKVASGHSPLAAFGFPNCRFHLQNSPKVKQWVIENYPWPAKMDKQKYDTLMKGLVEKAIPLLNYHLLQDAIDNQHPVASTEVKAKTISWMA